MSDAGQNPGGSDVVERDVYTGAGEPAPSADSVHDRQALVGRDLRTEELVLNIGPQHPATHGVLRVVIKTDGEFVRELEPHVGNLHRCAEKIGESVPYYQWLPYVDRMDYLAAMCNEHVAAMAIEKLGGVEVPERAEYCRVIIAEVQRILSHLMAIGVYGLDLGAFTPFLHQFRERERGMDLLDHISGGRLLYHYIQIGGVKRDFSREWLDELDAWLASVERRLPEYNTLLLHNRVFQQRTAHIGLINEETAKRWGVTGPGLRAAGVDWDLRRDVPYSVYDRFEFDVPCGESGIAGELGDCFNRHWIRVREVEESLKIIRQALAQMPEGPTMAKMPKSFKAPKGEVYVRGENPRGELAVYIVSDGKPTAYRMRCRGPSFSNIAVITEVARGTMIADLVALIGSQDIVLGEVDR